MAKSNQSVGRIPESRNEKNENLCTTFRFNVFSLGYWLINCFNFSWIPYYYDIKYGIGDRVITVLYRHCRFRFVVHSIQVLFLYICLCRFAYNGFGLHNYFNHSTKFHLDGNDDDDVWSITWMYRETTRLLWSFVIRIFTYDHYSTLVDYRRKVNVLMFIFTLNTFIQRIYCLLRFQKPISHRPELIGRLASGYSTGVIYENVRYLDFLVAPKMSIKEHITYCVFNRNLPQNLIDKYQILKRMTQEDIVNFDLLAIQCEKGILCTSQVYRILVAGTFVALQFIVVAVYITIYIEVKSVQIRENSLGFNDLMADYIEHFLTLVLHALNTIAFADSFIVLISSCILSNRLSIYNMQLHHFILQANKLYKSGYSSKIDLTSTQLYRFGVDNRTERDIVESIITAYYHHARTVGNSKHNEQESATRTVARNDSLVRLGPNQPSLDDRCEHMIIVLHQLLFEFKLIKTQFTKRTDLDLLISLCSATWILSSWIISNNCKSCEKEILASRLSSIIFIIVLIAYLSNIIIQIAFLAQFSQKVNYHKMNSYLTSIIFFIYDKIADKILFFCLNPLNTDEFIVQKNQS